MMKYTYLLIDFFTILVPFLFSFHPKLLFYQRWRAFFPAVLLTGALFIIWDIYFTHLGVWGFNSQYIVGLKLWGLPIEELLFFLCIPYSCVFTYHCLTKLLSLHIHRPVEDAITYILILVGIIGAIAYDQNWYTLSTAVLMVLLLFLSRFFLKVPWLGKFYLVYLILLIPFCIVNGLLTGTGLQSPVVWYNGEEIIGLRILTIPLEDVFYGMDLILLNLLLYHRFRGKLANEN